MSKPSNIHRGSGRPDSDFSTKETVPERETIARIIDPEVEQAKNDYRWNLPDGLWHLREQWALKKADAILALAMPEREAIARLSASEVACYRWPEDTVEHRAMRAAFCDGASHIALANQPAPERTPQQYRGGVKERDDEPQTI